MAVLYGHRIMWVTVSLTAVTRITRERVGPSQGRVKMIGNGEEKPQYANVSYEIHCYICVMWCKLMPCDIILLSIS